MAGEDVLNGLSKSDNGGLVMLACPQIKMLVWLFLYFPAAFKQPRVFYVRPIQRIP